MYIMDARQLPGSEEQPDEADGVQRLAEALAALPQEQRQALAEALEVN